MNKYIVSFLFIIGLLFSACRSDDEPQINFTFLLGQWELTDNNESNYICEFDEGECKREGLPFEGVFRVYKISSLEDVGEDSLIFEGGWGISTAHYIDDNETGYFDILITEKCGFSSLNEVLHQFHLKRLTKTQMIWIQFGNGKYEKIHFIRKS